jgi:hypothetical protein
MSNHASGVPILQKYAPVPYFFFYELMPLSKGVPPMFWKFTFALWNDVMTPTRVGDQEYVYKLKCAKSMSMWDKMHGVNRTSAMDYTAAYRYSGLFEIKYGFKHIEMMTGQPTEYLYRKGATQEEWRAFIVGLAEAYRTAKQWNMAKRRVLTEQDLKEINERKEIRNQYRDVTTQTREELLEEKPIDSSLAFQLLMAVNIDSARVDAGLPKVNSQYEEELMRQGAGKRDGDGRILFSFATTDRSRLG